MSKKSNKPETKKGDIRTLGNKVAEPKEDVPRETVAEPKEVSAGVRGAMESAAGMIETIMVELDKSGIDTKANSVYQNLVNAKKHLETGMGYIKDGT